MGKEPREAAPFPSRIGRFRVLGPLGVGGMASVYLAVSEGAAGFEREVALKVLHPHLVSDAHLVEQFLTEARVAAKIRHPHVVPVMDVMQDRSWVYLVMDFVEGASLAELRRAARAEGTALPPRIWGRWLADALSGLHAAHELTDERGEPLGVVHRDFSPQNILIGRDGSARLSDFGVVKLTSGDKRTQSGIVKGKVNYMSPEQVRGESLDRRCDVWAAGVVAWELATGKRLRKHKDDVQTLLEIVSGDPPRASSALPDISSELDELIAWALTSDLSHRCPSAAELRARLLQALGPGGVADSAECADWMQRHAGEMLDARKQKLLAARALREQLDSLFDSPSSLDTTPLTVDRESKERSLAEPASSAPTRPRKGRRLGLIALGIAGVAATALAVVARASDPPEGIVERVEPVPAALPSAPPPAPVKAATSRILLEANQPIAALAIDGRDVAIGKPASRIELELPEFARGRDELKLDAKSTAGSAASLLWSGDGPARFEFSARTPRRPPPPPKKKPSTKTTPLAGNPYAE